MGFINDSFMGLAFSVTVRCARIHAGLDWKQGEAFAALRICCLEGQ